MKCVKCNTKQAWYDGRCKECCNEDYNKVNLNIDMTRNELDIFQNFINTALLGSITKEEEVLLKRFVK